MRFIEFEQLNEAMILLKTGYNPKGAKIFRNPSKRELHALIEYSKQRTVEEYKKNGVDINAPTFNTDAGELRGIVENGVVFIWSGWDGTHHGVTKYLEDAGYIEPTESPETSFDEVENPGIGFILSVVKNKMALQNFNGQRFRFNKDLNQQVLKKWYERVQ